MSARAKIALLIAAHFVVTPVMAWLSFDEFWPHPTHVLWNAASAVKTPLAAMWLVFAATKLRWRIVLATCSLLLELVIEYVWYDFRYVDGYQRQFTWDKFVNYSVVVPVVVGALIAYRVRFRLVWCHLGQLSARRFQFSIRQLLLLTFSIALLLGVGSLIHAHCSYETTTRATDTIATALVALVSVWATLNRGQPYLRLGAAIIAAAGIAAWQVNLLTHLEWPEREVWAGMNFLVALMALGSLLVVRSSGYRLISSSADSPSRTKEQ